MTEIVKPFKWAHGPEANIKEPIEFLKEKGWQYADVPTASNFNWLFAEIQKELELLSSANKDLDGKLVIVNAKLKTVEKNCETAQGDADSALTKGENNYNKIQHVKGLLTQACTTLKTKFPNDLWPAMTDPRSVGTREEPSSGENNE